MQGAGLDLVDALGSLTVQSGATFAVDCGAAASICAVNIVDVTNNGTIDVTRGIVTLAGLTNLVAGTMTGGTYSVSGGGKLDLPTSITTNAATIVQDGPGSRLRDDSALPALSTLSSNTGSLTLTNAGAAINQATASPLTSTGTLIVGSNYTLSATTLVTAGTLWLDGTIDGALQVGAAATLDVDITGATAGQFTSGSVTGAATFNGAISVDASGYAPAASHALRVVSAASASGTPGALTPSSLATPWTLGASIDATGLLLAPDETELPGAPGTPTSTSHAATAVADSTIDGVWTAATDGSGSGIAGYSIEFSTSASTTPDSTADTAALTTTSAARAAGTWYLHVRAIDAAGNAGPASHSDALVVSATTTTAAPDTSAPSAPGTPTSSSHSSTSITFDTTVDVAWAAATDDTAVTGYSYEFSQVAITTPDATADTTGMTATSTALREGWWYVHVRAIDAAGNAGSAAHSARMYVGVRATGCTPGGATILRATGTAAANRIIGTNGRNVLRGMGGNDALVGLDGNDTLLGGTGLDRLCGGSGSDTITGGAGRDNVVAGAGNDLVNEFDGAVGDVIDCGAGRDVARIDRGDRTRNCESVRFA